MMQAVKCDIAEATLHSGKMCPTIKAGGKRRKERKAKTPWISKHLKVCMTGYQNDMFLIQRLNYY